MTTTATAAARQQRWQRLLDGWGRLRVTSKFRSSKWVCTENGFHSTRKCFGFFIEHTPKLILHSNVIEEHDDFIEHSYLDRHLLFMMPFILYAIWCLSISFRFDKMEFSGFECRDCNGSPVTIIQLPYFLSVSIQLHYFIHSRHITLHSFLFDSVKPLQIELFIWTFHITSSLSVSLSLCMYIFIYICTRVCCVVVCFFILSRLSSLNRTNFLRFFSSLWGKTTTMNLQFTKKKNSKCHYIQR